MTATELAVLHRSIPGPRSADPRDRQVFRRILELADLGFAITLVPAELLPEGGAPTALRSAGVTVDVAYREGVPRRLARLDSPGACLVTTSLLLPRAHREAVLGWTGPVVVDLDHLPSQERLLGRTTMRDAEQPGIDTEIEHLVAIESELLERADLVMTPTAEVAATVPLGAAVVPPAALPEPARSSDVAAHVVMPARLTDEWATPDEGALPALDQVISGLGIDQGVLITPEDTVARLRHNVRCSAPIAALRESADATSASGIALDLRSYGVPTFTRRFELSAAGVPWVATSTALGIDDPAMARLDFGELASLFVADDPDGQAAAVRALLAEEELRDELVKVQRAHMLSDVDGTASALLAAELASAGIIAAPGSRSTGRTEAALQTTEYLVVPNEGTLAAADPRIEALEAEMLPIRLHDRDTSINLQSTVDADARYRVFARTHLEAPPASTPTQTPESTAVRFSVLVPTYDTDPDLLDECIASVAAQQHDNWELCIVDDGSPSDAHHEVLRRWEEADDRILVQFNPWNQGIGLASNDALAMAAGDWIVLLDHDDVLKPDALAWCARYITTCPEYDMWYSDEDKILLDGQLGMPFFKPDWSPDFVRGVNYVCHLLCARAEVVDEVGGFRRGFDGAQDYDLVLRLTERIAERGSSVGHIAKPLYSWRMIPGSTALATSEKPAAHHAGQRALEESIVRRFEPATVSDGEYDTTHRIRYSVDTSELLTIMIPTRDRVDLLANCISRVRETTGGIDYELLIVDNDSEDPATLAYMDELVAEGHQVVRYPHEFSFARQVNLGTLHARGDLLLILNNDTWARNDDWLLRMMEHAQRPEVGMVGAKLMFPEGMRGDRPQHEGIVMGMAGLAYNIDLGGYMGMDQFVRDTSGVTAACAMVRPSVLLGVGGMEERLRVAYNDVDFGLRIGEYGYRVVYTPHAVLEHPESASRGSLHPGEDELWLLDRWGDKGSVREPFISPQLEWCMPVFYRL
ncbi:MAG: glycosyltransferase [Actinomycetia bacterium]|nr:glycosyltransferase [Actinomycetes bacterium]